MSYRKHIDLGFVGLASLMGGLVFSWAMGSSVGQDKTLTVDRLETRELVVRDKGGKYRAVLKGGDEGFFLEIGREGRVQRIRIGVGKDGTAILGVLGETRGIVALRHKGTGEAALLLGAETREPTVLLAAQPDGDRGLAVREADGKARLWVGLGKRGEAGLVARPAGESDGNVAILSTGSSSSAQFTDSQGRRRIVLGVGDDDSAGVRLLDPEGKTRALMRSRGTQEASLQVIDASGSEIWFAGTNGEGEQRVGEGR